MMVEFQTSPFGRPELAPSRDVSFNVSQAGDLTVVAVARGREVGVDVERLRPVDDVMDLAEGLFAQEEVDLLRTRPPRDRAAMFLTLWTRKEAVVKTIGVGLSMPLDRFIVSTQEGATVGRPRGAQGPLPYAFAPLQELAGYVGTVAVAGTEITVRYCDAREMHGC
jgi:4'-phosphopantetheinyl transferase